MVDIAADTPWTNLKAGRTGPLVLLFYDGYELKARASWVKRGYHALRCLARAWWRKAKGKQVNTGFYVAFDALCDGLRHLGCDVRINDFAAARADPNYPIGLAGYPSVIDQVRLPNPIIFGPGDPGYPVAAGAWAEAANVRHIIQPCEWFVDYYRPYCGERMLRCPVGIDLETLVDTQHMPKTVDVLIYDKIRWNREQQVPAVRDRLIANLRERGLSFIVLEYGKHTQQMFFTQLKAARSMAFICEHETQGLACEEALAMNVPVFAWEEGVLVDPLQRPFAAPDLRVSSVPYFDSTCGDTFTEANLEQDFERFWSNLDSYAPREYIAANLTPAATAQVYLAAFNRIAVFDS